MQISPETYDGRMQKFMEEAGPNPGNSFFHKWSWDASKRHEFRDILRAEGYDIAPEEPDDDDEF